MARRPSSRLQTRRSWIPAAATTSQSDTDQPAAVPARQNATPAIAANTMLATDTWLGRTPARARARATAEGQARLRVRSWRRLGACMAHEDGAPHRRRLRARQRAGRRSYETAGPLETSLEPPHSHHPARAVVAHLVDGKRLGRPLHEEDRRRLARVRPRQVRLERPVRQEPRVHVGARAVRLLDVHLPAVPMLPERPATPVDLDV